MLHIVSDFHIAINVEWLEALNLEMPKTPDEFVNVLKEFVTKDPNGNGKNARLALFLRCGPESQTYMKSPASPAY